MKRVISLLAILLTISFPLSVSAANLEVAKEVTTYEMWNSDKGGDIIFTIGYPAVEGETYKYQLSYNDKITAWYEVTSATEEGIKVTLDKSKQDVLSILSSSNEAYLSVISEKDGVQTSVLSSHKVDISMPLSRAYKIGHFTSGYHGIKAAYDVDKIYYQYKKVDNIELIKK